MFFLEIIFIFILLYISYLLAYSLIRGAPYAPIGKKRLACMIELLDMKGGNFIDIGSGDGRIVIAAAAKGVTAYGIEINPLFALISKIKIKKLRIKKAKIIQADLWQHSFARYDYISVWGTKHMMANLEKKLHSELKPGTKVVSNHYKFPNWKIAKLKNDVYLYIR